MSLEELIKKATYNAGSQKALAELIGVSAQNLSDFKRGRPCGYRKRAQIAAVAGEDPIRVLIQGFSDELDDSIQHEAEFRTTLKWMLDTFPAKKAKTKGPNESQNIKLRTSQRYCFKTGYSPVFFCPLFSARSRRMTILLTPNSAATRV